MSLRASGIKLVLFTVIAALIGAMLVFTLRDSTFQRSTTYHATFADVSGLRSGDRVRIAGVAVGRIEKVKLVPPGGCAGDANTYDVDVAFSVPSSTQLTTSTQADVRYQNLLGQRYLALTAGNGGGSPLRKPIVCTNTAPALDLTTLLNGFQPLFSALAPDQVNTLSASLIQVLQGEQDQTGDLVAQLATVTSTLANRDQAIDQVVDDLATVAQSVGTHSADLDRVIAAFEQVSSGVAATSGKLGTAITSTAALTTTLAQTLQQSQPAITTDISTLKTASDALAANRAQIDSVITGAPALFDSLIKISSHGSWLQVYVCDLSTQIYGTASLPGGLTLPGVSAGVPLKFPSGPVGDQSLHTRNCS